ncbi:MAG TPA: carbon-nitrogen hydrolase family protein, partial [Candidatus Marinimicrobia bacterium]|nr:carbon-nitrogen hydrolase family protein [Candidatus Neomarinimicrobiota bacterium]
MIIAIIQQHASRDNEDNLNRGLIAIDKASEQGAELAVFAELSFTRFFPQNHASGSVAHLSEKVPGPTTEAFMEKAKKH